MSGGTDRLEPSCIVAIIRFCSGDFAGFSASPCRWRFMLGGCQRRSTRPSPRSPPRCSPTASARSGSSSFRVNRSGRSATGSTLPAPRSSTGSMRRTAGCARAAFGSARTVGRTCRSRRGPLRPSRSSGRRDRPRASTGAGESPRFYPTPTAYATPTLLSTTADTSANRTCGSAP